MVDRSASRQVIVVKEGLSRWTGWHVRTYIDLCDYN